MARNLPALRLRAPSGRLLALGHGDREMKFRIDTKNNVWLGGYWMAAGVAARGDAYNIVAALCEDWEVRGLANHPGNVVAHWKGYCVFVGPEAKAREFIAHRILTECAP